MRFFVSTIGDAESWNVQATPEEIEQMVDQMGAFNEEIEKAGVFVTAEGLGPSGAAKTLRYGENGKVVVTDGPYAETKEQLAGYWIFECKDIDEAVEWAKKIPASEGSTVEIRPIPATVDENIEAYREQAKS